MNSDIIAGLVSEHTTTEPVVVYKHDEKNTLLVFTESEDIEKYEIHFDPLRCGLVAM